MGSKGEHPRVFMPASPAQAGGDSRMRARSAALPNRRLTARRTRAQCRVRCSLRQRIDGDRRCVFIADLPPSPGSSAMRLVPYAALVGGLAFAVPSPAFFDAKALAPGAACVPYAPDTTGAELQFTPSGIYNPGTSIEKVLCSLPRDQDSAYTAGQMFAAVTYRVLGAAPGRITCTVFVGSAQQQTDAVYTSTAVGMLVASGTRGSIQLEGATQPAGTHVVPVAMVCAISPKTWLSTIYFDESDQTQTGP
jgi:hypothetical protein